MTKSEDVSVVLQKIPTFLTIVVEPTSGTPPLAIAVHGRLARVDTAAGVNAKTVHLVVNGVRVASTKTYTRTVVRPPLILPGYYEFKHTLSQPGANSIHTEFDGDTTYEGCEEQALFAEVGVFEW